MNIQSALAMVNKLLDEGHAEEATAAIADSAAELSQDPRVLMPILDRLDRQRKDEAITPLIAKLQELSLLPLECSIFEMRMKFRRAKYGEALKAVDRVLAISGNNVEALRTGGRIGNLMHDEMLSLRYWERLGHTSSADPEAALQAARIYFRRQHYPQALNWAQLAAEGRPDSSEPLQIAVSAGMETGWPEACDSLLAGLFRVERARALKSLSRLAQELDCESAARLLSSLQPQFPNDQNIAEIVAKAFSEWLVSALEQELASRELEAAAFYRAARKVQPNNANPLRALDRLSSPSLLAMREAFNSRDFAGAIEHGEMAARINPECFEAWQTVGRALFTRGSGSEAANAFRHCTELDPKDAHSWLTYGLVLNQSGNRPGALRAFQAAKGLGDPEVKREAEASVVALHPQLVREAHQTATDGKIEQAWQAIEAALTVRGDDASMAQLRRNLLRQQQNQIREAWNAGTDSVTALCRSYLNKAPGDPYVSTVLGRTLMRSRLYGEALPIWESLCRQNPQDSHFHLQIGRCCRALKLKERGLSALETALRLTPDLKEAAEMMDFFKGLPASANVDTRARR